MVEVVSLEKENANIHALSNNPSPGPNTTILGFLLRAPKESPFTPPFPESNS